MPSERRIFRELRRDLEGKFSCRTEIPYGRINERGTSAESCGREGGGYLSERPKVGWIFKKYSQPIYESQLLALEMACRGVSEAEDIAKLVKLLATGQIYLVEQKEEQPVIEYMDSRFTFGYIPITAVIDCEPTVEGGFEVWSAFHKPEVPYDQYRKALKFAIEVIEKEEITHPSDVVKKVRESL